MDEESATAVELTGLLGPGPSTEYCRVTLPSRCKFKSLRYIQNEFLPIVQYLNVRALTRGGNVRLDQMVAKAP